jgi:hypothetical protein
MTTEGIDWLLMIDPDYAIDSILFWWLCFGRVLWTFLIARDSSFVNFATETA